MPRVLRKPRSPFYCGSPFPQCFGHRSFLFPRKLSYPCNTASFVSHPKKVSTILATRMVRSATKRMVVSAQELFSIEKMAVAGMGNKKIATAVGLPQSTTQRWLQRLRSFFRVEWTWQTASCRSLSCFFLSLIGAPNQEKKGSFFLRTHFRNCPLRPKKWAHPEIWREPKSSKLAEDPVLSNGIVGLESATNEGRTSNSANVVPSVAPLLSHTPNLFLTLLSTNHRLQRDCESLQPFCSTTAASPKSTAASKACCLPNPHQIWDMTTFLLCHFQLSLDDFAFISLHLAFCCSLSTPCNGVIFVFPFLALRSTCNFAFRPTHVEKPCLRPSSANVVRTNQTPSCIAHFCQYTFFSCLIDVFLISSRHVPLKVINLPLLILRTCQLGTVIPRSFISQKTAHAGPLTSVHDVASHTCLFQASLTSASHCPVHTACAQKHVTAHASSWSISRLLISRKSDNDPKHERLRCLGESDTAGGDSDSARR